MFLLCNSKVMLKKNKNVEVHKCISNVRNQMHFIIGNIIIYDNFNISSSDRIDLLYTLYLELEYIMFRNGKGARVSIGKVFQSWTDEILQKGKDNHLKASSSCPVNFKLAHMKKCTTGQTH